MAERGKAEQQAARSARLAAALRENLKRRKAQARGRAQNRPRTRRNPPEIAGRSRTLPTFAAIGAAIRTRRRTGRGGQHGSHSHRRRPAAHRHDPDLGGEERHASPDDRQPVDRSDARSRQRAETGRRRPVAAHPRQSRRRRHGQRQAPRRDRRSRPDAADFRRPYRRYHRALRAGVEDAGEFLGDRAAGGADGPGAGVDARRLRHRHAAGRSA